MQIIDLALESLIILFLLSSLPYRCPSEPETPMINVITTTPGTVMVVTVATLTLESEIKLTQAPIHHPMKADGAKQKQLKHGLSPVINQLSSGQLAAAGSKHVTQVLAGVIG